MCVCGATMIEFEDQAGEKVAVGGVSAVRFDFFCAECARLREFTFRMTEPSAEEQAARQPGVRVIGLARSAAEAHCEVQSS